MEKQKWEWKWNPWIGIMYGPIPVGIIVVGGGWLIYVLVK